MGDIRAKSPHAAYLGDGVYVDLDRYGDVILTTENGIEQTNVIVMERDAVRELGRWLLRVEVSTSKEAP